MKAIIYARVSSVGERQNTERQVKDLMEYASYMKYDVLKVFEEHISGAKKNSERAVLQEAIDYCILNKVDILLSSELSRIGRSSFEVLETVKKLIDNKVNLYLQKEQMTLLDEKGEPSVFVPVTLACLSCSACLERENIQYRLNSGRRLYIERGGRLGRRVGSVKTREQKEQEYRDVLSYLRKGYKVKDTAKLTNKSEKTVSRLKKEFCL
ncbi:MAG: recombinase family protein [Bacteroidales bacterium]|jgi:DNA invertase Pin-like site-specific DNA recombinase|nr:recombinase family protein [Bacteroidales bacterium]